MHQKLLIAVRAVHLLVNRLIPGLLLIPVLGIAESFDEPPQPWYQIEIMVFANQKSAADDEHWSAVERSYPAQLLFIGPVTGDALSPLNLGQLKQLDQFEQLLSAVETTETNTAPDNGFLFQSMGRKPTLYVDTSLSEDDLLAGITREPEPNTTGPVTTLTESGTKAESQPSLAPTMTNSLKPVDISALFEMDNRVVAYQNLPENQLTLTAVRKRIEQSPQYKLLYHGAWRQQIQPMQDAAPILLQGGDQYDDQFELDGYVTISRSRFLHLNTHLWYTQFDPRSGQSSIVLPDSTQFYSPEDRSLLRKYPRVQHYEAMRDNYLPTLVYPMLQSRKLKLSALHFLDHPAFGLLIRIEEYDPVQLTGAR